MPESQTSRHTFNVIPVSSKKVLSPLLQQKKARITYKYSTPCYGFDICQLEQWIKYIVNNPSMHNLLILNCDLHAQKPKYSLSESSILLIKDWIETMVSCPSIRVNLLSNPEVIVLSSVTAWWRDIFHNLRTNLFRCKISYCLHWITILFQLFFFFFHTHMSSYLTNEDHRSYKWW